jgi:hypothetical protein
MRNPKSRKRKKAERKKADTLNIDGAASGQKQTLCSPKGLPPLPRCFVNENKSESTSRSVEIRPLTHKNEAKRTFDARHSP